MKTFSFLLVLTVILFSTIGFSQSYNPDYLDGVVFFKLKENVPIESETFIKNLPFRSETEKIVDFNDYPDISSALTGYSVTKLERPSYYSKKPTLMRIFRVYFSDYSEINDIIKTLAQLPFVEYAERSPIRKISLVPNDALYSQTTNKWYFTLVNAEQAWNISTGSNNIKVAIVDNAVFCGHSDLTTFAQRDVADSDNDATPPLDANTDFGWSHGTHCAGLATADVNNGIGMASLGGNVELIGIKCTPDNGSSSSVYYGYSGVQWACQNGANVVSMSWGGGGYNNSEQTLINSYPGIIFFAAAGNDGVSTEMYPGAYDNIVCVGSVDSDDSRSSFSNYNGSTNWVDIASPGGYSNSGLLNTVYTSGGNNYGKMGGTSMATPFAAGLAGLMLSLNPSLSPSEIEACMISSGHTINQSIGPRIDAYAALQCIQGTLNGDPNAYFIANTTTVPANSSVTFTDLSSNGGIAITSWQWSFPGGTPSTFSGETPPAITYTTIGNYDVTLTVTNSQSSSTETKTAYINVVVEPYGGWINQASGFTAQYRGINNISIVSPSVVWATAYDGSGGTANVQEFTKTTNGGTTWTPGTINIGNTALGISMIHAYDATTAWLAAFPNASGQTGGIWKTINGGTTWTRQTSATYTNASSFTNVVYFWDANNGFCMGDPINSDFECYRTSNGGTTWTLVPGANLPVPLSGEYGYTRQIEVVGDVVWFTTNKGRIYKSTDRGLNWVVYQSPLTDFGGTVSGNLQFKDANTGMIVTNAAAVYKSTNGGSTWTLQTTTGTVNTTGLCWVAGTDIIFSTGTAGSSFSQDAGLTWSPIDAQQHTAVEFTSPSVGYSGWFNSSATADGMWKWQNTSTLEADFSGVPIVICTGGTVDFTDLTSGGNPSSWSWSFPGGIPSSSTVQNPQNITYNTAGTYDVILTVDDGNGPVTKTITSYITVNSAPAQPSPISGDISPCPGVSKTYSVGLVYGVNYAWTLPNGWSGSSVTNSIDVMTGTDPGTISVTPSNSCGTGTPSEYAVTIIPIPVASFSYTMNQNEVTFTNTSSPNGTDFFWNFGDGGSAAWVDPVYIYAAAGDYEVMFIVNNLCGADTSYQTITVTIVGIDGTGSDNFKLYPVPATTELYAEFNGKSKQMEYSVLDICGKKVITGKINAGEKMIMIDVSGLAKGVYTLDISNGESLYKQKIVIR